MASVRSGRHVEASDLGSYQSAVRHVLTCALITEQRPWPGVLGQVLRWADEMTRDFRELLGYTLIATGHYVRLVRRFDTLDSTQRSVFCRNGRQFDRRRLAYLCLALGSFRRSRIEVNLADLVRIFTPAANSIAGLGFDPTVHAHKAAFVDVLRWLLDRGALRLSDGSLDSWERDTERGDALFDIDHEICTALFKPARPIQHVTSASGLLHEAPGLDAPAGGEVVARQARRLLVELPVVYDVDVPPAVADVLHGHDFAEELARLTGLVVERRAEGVMLADPSESFTDRRFPGRGSAVSRAAGLLLAKIACLPEGPEDEARTLSRMPAPTLYDEHVELVARVDAGLPAEGIVAELAQQIPPEAGEDGQRDRRQGGESFVAPFVQHSRLRALTDELYEEFGAGSFSAKWREDPAGLLEAAIDFLTDLLLLRRCPGGVLVLPAAPRYRNITGALPAAETGGQLSLELPQPDVAAAAPEGVATDTGEARVADEED